MQAVADSLIEQQNQDIRRDILSILNADGDYSMNETGLLTALAVMENRISRDRLRTNLAWLKEQGFITLKEIPGLSIFVAKLTYQGADIAEGLTTAPGVARLPL